jgi:hypothetical protein
MIQVKKILLASDFLMTKESEQDSNLRWLRDLYASPIGQACGTRIRVASFYFDRSWTFSRDTFFKKSTIDFSPVDVHLSFDPECLSEASLNMVSAAIGPDTLVIGYEMSVQTRQVLDRIGQPYIDIWLGPVRFLDDLTFAIRASDPEMNERIDKFAIDPEYIEVQARILKVQSYRGFSRQALVLKPESALFAGQLLTDKALLKDGRMMSLLDFKKEFSEISKRHSTVYYARHPFLKKGDERILAFARSFRNVVMSETTGYGILCHENLASVYGITSSLVTEARYFGKEARHLSQPTFETVGVGEQIYRLVMQQMLFPSFWRAIFNGSIEDSVNPLSMGKDKLRDALSFYWSYRQIDKLEYVRAIAARNAKIDADII